MLCPDVPPQLPAVLGKMMAKGAQDRFQTPREVAAALTQFCSAVITSRAPAEEPAGPTPAPAAIPPENDSDLEDNFSVFDSLAS